MGKNIQRVQSMLDGDYKRNTQVGYEKENVRREVGDIWVDEDGVKWEQKTGYRMKHGLMPDVGLFSKKCQDCKKPCTKVWDKTTYDRMGRCYYCQIDFEAVLEGKGIRKYWIRLHQLRNMEIIDKEMEQLIFQRHEERKNVFDESVANALANTEIDNTLKINKNLTGG
tara:strand:- start:48 stop:551 length:504 start_codon:yes stop_codon:yes gene_type:complete